MEERWRATERRLEDIAALARGALVKALPGEDIGAMLERLDVVEAAPGVILAREGDAGDALCFLLSGRAGVERQGTRITSLEPGDTFGELTFAGAPANGATVMALSPVRFARLTRAGFLELGRSRPATALHISSALLESVARDLACASGSPALPARGAPRAGGYSAATGAREATLERRPDPSTIAVTIGSVTTSVPMGTRIVDLFPQEIDGAPVVGAMRGNVVSGLSAPLLAGAVITPLSTADWQGREIYRQSAGLALLEAARWAGSPSIRLGPSITSGRVVHVDAGADIPALCAKLSAALAEIIRRDTPIVEELWTIEDAMARFSADGWHDAALLLEAWQEPGVMLVRCGDVVAIGQGPMLMSAGALSGVEIVPHPNGLLLDFGPAIRRHLSSRPGSTRVIEMSAPRYGAEMTRREGDWLSLLGVTSIGHFNRACVTGQIKELILVSEGFHEKRIALLADDVKARGDVRIIAVAGPSASGKTTLIKRLKVQLEVNGVHPIELSLDDYYQDRERCPRDARGEYDFEAIEALDLALLEEHTTRLLGGETVRTAHFNFLTGKSERSGGPELRVGPSDVLLIEGIHALSPALLDEPAVGRVLRVFVHPATALPFDRLTSFEPADVRLLRRIVRDRHGRGTSAADNLARWSSVRRGEREHIFPYQGNADAVFDSSLVYEIGVLRVYAERYLREVPRAHPEFPAAHRLRRLLAPFVPIHPDLVPPTSILREFIGGSGFSY